jgi:hypothetical protein
MALLATSMVLWLAASAGEMAPATVQAPNSPIQVSRAKVFNIVADEPAVLFYAATNLTDNDLEEFTIVAYIFDAKGTLRARQTAPGRRSLEKRSTKYSTMVLDGWAVTATDRVVFGVNQALRVGSEKWWHAELEEAAKEAVKGLKLP